MSAHTLPLELWYKIIGWATAVPGALEENPRDPFATPPRLPFFEEDTRLRASLRTKLSILRVCRAWNEFAARYLYEDVHLTDARTMELLAGVLQGGQGLWTRTLRLRMLEQSTEHAVELDLLVPIVRSMPNLAILVICIRGDAYTHLPLPQTVVQALIETCANSLKMIYAWNNRLHFSRDDWARLLAAAPSLVHIHHETLAPPILPQTLRSVTLRSSWSEPLSQWLPAGCSFDDLRSVRYVGAYETDFPLYNALYIFGQSIERLEIDQYSGPTQCDPVRELPVVCELCPRLRHLILQLNAWTDIPDDLRFPPTLTHLGLRCSLWAPPSDDFEVFFEAFRYLEADSLKVVRILEARSADDIRTHEGLLPTAGYIFHERGFCLEDDIGDTILGRR